MQLFASHYRTTRINYSVKFYKTQTKHLRKKKHAKLLLNKILVRQIYNFPSYYSLFLHEITLCAISMSACPLGCKKSSKEGAFKNILLTWLDNASASSCSALLPL